MKQSTLVMVALWLPAALAGWGQDPLPLPPITDDQLARPQAADWPGWRRDLAASGYSPLDQIHRENVRQLRLAWSRKMERGPQQQEPLVYRGVMFLPHANDVVQALEADSGRLLWEYRREQTRHLPEDTTRNIALYGDKVYLTTRDGYLVALEMATGRVVWEVQVGDPARRLNFSTGPIAARGKIFAGTTCGVGTPLPCFLSAHEAESGRLLWRRESVAGPSDPPEHNATWGPVPYTRRRKSSFWLTGSYDPQLDLVYWTTASAYPYPEIHKGTGAGALLYTNSLLAVEADSGELAWFFQMLPRDNFDMDHQDNPILADLEGDGARRRLVVTLGKPGILWAFDREKGTYLWHRQLVSHQNLYRSIDPLTGAIQLNEELIPRQVGDTSLVCPGVRGGKLFQTHAYHPPTATIFSPVSQACTRFRVVPLETRASGLDYDEILPMPGAEGKVGRLVAVSAATGEIRWTYEQKAALGSVLATAGGLVFVGDLHRFFRALDADTGKLLWEADLKGPVTGYPISYSVRGKQYVAVAAGGDSPGRRHLARLYPELKSPLEEHALMVFALP